jgi:ubiquinone/menaquinone biosynthesis C-methylase UbiE
MAKTENNSQLQMRASADQEKHARALEQEVYPFLGERLAEQLTRGNETPRQGKTLQIGCGLGSTAGQILAQMENDSRLVVVEAHEALIERARTKVNADEVNRRVFFRAIPQNDSLPFADDSFDTILANVALSEVTVDGAVLIDYLRVLKPGGQLRLATLTEGTWREFLDIYQDVLLRLRNQAMIEALSAYARSFPNPELLSAQLNTLGFRSVTSDIMRWELLFRSAREFFYSPVIEFGPLPRWKAIAGKGSTMQDVMFALKEAIDIYFGPRPFTASIYGGRFLGTKP